MTQASNHRSDVQVLRAIAVIAVIAYHAGLPVRSGFLGVDVFLVISGYVICATLLREGSRTGLISIPKFYVRRVRRLFLPLITMLTVSMLLFWMFGPFIAHRLVVKQAFSAFGFFANIHYFSMAGGYFDPEISASYFLNTWSLSLEEQFYLVFPLVIALIVFLSRRTTAQARNRNVFIGIVVLTVSSLVFSWWLVASIPVPQVFAQFDLPLIDLNKIDTESFAFFSPLTRAWQFLVGAACAVGPAREWQMKERRARKWFELAILTLLGALLVIGGSASTNFFALSRVAATVVTGLLVYTGFDGFAKLSAIGDRSYSLYLWHFPLLTLVSLKFGSSATSRTVAVLVSIVCAELSYRFIETRSLTIDVEIFFKRIYKVLIVAIVGFALVATAGILGIAQKVAKDLLGREVVAGSTAPWDVPSYRCAHVDDGGVYQCDSGIAPDSQLYLIGDSHAMGLALGFGAAAEVLKMSWSADTRPGCTFARFDFGVQSNVCDAWVESTFQRALTLQPELVVLFQCYRVGKGCPQPQMSDAERDKFVAGVAAIVFELNAAGISVLQVLDTPAISPQQFNQSLFLNKHLGLIQPGATQTNAEIERQLGIFAQLSNGRYLLAEITTGLCTASTCRLVDEKNRPLWFDTDHLSSFGVADRTEPLRSAMEKALIQKVSP